MTLIFLLSPVSVNPPLPSDKAYPAYKNNRMRNRRHKRNRRRKIQILNRRNGGFRLYCRKSIISRCADNSQCCGTADARTDFCAEGALRWSKACLPHGCVPLSVFFAQQTTGKFLILNLISIIIPPYASNVSGFFAHDNELYSI